MAQDEATYVYYMSFCAVFLSVNTEGQLHLVWTTNERTATYGVQGKVFHFRKHIHELPAIVVAREPSTLALYNHAAIWWKIL